MKKANIRVRRMLGSYGIPVWRLADALGKSESTLHRILRHELPESEQDRICQMIEEIAKGER